MFLPGLPGPLSSNKPLLRELKRESPRRCRLTGGGGRSDRHAALLDLPRQRGHGGASKRLRRAAQPKASAILETTLVSTAGSLPPSRRSCPRTRPRTRAAFPDGRDISSIVALRHERLGKAGRSWRPPGGPARACRPASESVEQDVVSGTRGAGRRRAISPRSSGAGRAGCSGTAYRSAFPPDGSRRHDDR